MAVSLPVWRLGVEAYEEGRQQMWELKAPTTLAPGLQVHLYSRTPDSSRLGRAVILTVGTEQLLLQVLEGSSAFQRGDGVVVMAKSQESLLRFESKVLSARPQTREIALLTPPSVFLRQLRRYQRVDVQAPCTFRWFQFSSGEAFPIEKGTVLNVSKGGILLAAEAEPKSDYLSARVYLSGELPVFAECRVASSRKTAEPNAPFQIGLQFVLVEAEVLRSIDLFVAQRSAGESIAKAEKA